MRTLFRTVPLRTASFIVAGLMSACGPTPTENIVFRIELIAGPNLIKNGSFEDDREAKFVTRQDEPIVPAGGVGGVPFKELCGNSNSLTNWEVTRIGAKQQDCTPAQTGGAFVAMSWFDVQNNSIGITAPDGRMAVNLLGFPRSPPVLGSIAQTIQTAPGYNYALSFWVGSSNVFNTRQNSIQVDVIDAETKDIRLSERIPAPAVDTPSDWGKWKIDRTFTATGSRTTISFTASASGGDAQFVGLDDVRVHCYGRPGFFFLGGC
jgi:Protein of unknown function (DUF642)